MSASSDKPPSSSTSAFAFSPINATIWNTSSSSSPSSNASLPKWSEPTTSWPSSMTGSSLARDPLQSSHNHNNILTNRDEKENYSVNGVPRGDLPKDMGSAAAIGRAPSSFVDPSRRSRVGAIGEGRLGGSKFQPSQVSFPPCRCHHRTSICRAF